MAKATKKQVLGRGLSALLKDNSIDETNTNLVVGSIVEIELENIEVKREKISKVDSDINDVRKKKEEADEKMKKLERTLVEVLVEQQKNLLVILQQER